jgi:hypothetical protein
LVSANRKAIGQHNDGCLAHWQKILTNVRVPNVLFVRQESSSDSGVSTAGDQDCNMLNEAGIPAVIEQTDWSRQSLFNAIGVHNPTHVVYEAAMSAVSAIRCNRQQVPISVRDEPIQNDFLDVMSKVRI